MFVHGNDKGGGSVVLVLIGEGKASCLRPSLVGSGSLKRVTVPSSLQVYSCPNWYPLSFSAVVDAHSMVYEVHSLSLMHRARIISPLPLRVVKTGRNHLNENFTPLLPTGIGERF